MKPIINPLYFYLIDVCDRLSFILLIIVILLLLSIIILAICIFLDEGDVKSLKIYLKKGAIITSLCAVVLILLPSKEACYEMMITNYVTSDNIEIAKDEIKEIIDYVTDSIDKIDDKEED